LCRHSPPCGDTVHLVETRPPCVDTVHHAGTQSTALLSLYVLHSQPCGDLSTLCRQVHLVETRPPCADTVHLVETRPPCVVTVHLVETHPPCGGQSTLRRHSQPCVATVHLVETQSTLWRHVHLVLSQLPARPPLHPFRLKTLHNCFKPASLFANVFPLFKK
jgi:hypothetical protein